MNYNSEIKEKQILFQEAIQNLNPSRHFPAFCVIAKPVLTIAIAEIVLLNKTKHKKRRQQQEHFLTRRKSECFRWRRGMKSTCFSNLDGCCDCCCNTTSTTCQSDSCGGAQAQPAIFTDGKQGKITVWSEWFTVSSISSNCHLANYSCAAGLSKKAWLFYWGRGDSINNTTSVPHPSLLCWSRLIFPHS